MHLIIKTVTAIRTMTADILPTTIKIFKSSFTYKNSKHKVIQRKMQLKDHTEDEQVQHGITCLALSVNNSYIDKKGIH